VRVGDWKLIHYPFINRSQLFNLASDPYETNDLSSVANQAGQIKDLATQLILLQGQYGDWQRLGQLGYVGANIARGCTAWQSSTLSGDPAYAATNATDGAGSTLTGFAQTDGNDTSPWWMVDLGASYSIEEVLLHNRADASQGRLRDISVEVLDAQTNVVASSGLLNPNNTLGGGSNIFTNGPGVLYGGFTNTVPVGRFVRVSRTPSSIGSGADQNSLALSEVQVFAARYNAGGESLNRLSPPNPISPGTVNLSYLGIPGFRYALDWATNLYGGPAWTPVATNNADANGTATFTNTSTQPQNFFRTRYVP
jgi:hypothetical protein